MQKSPRQSINKAFRLDGHWKMVNETSQTSEHFSVMNVIKKLIQSSLLIRDQSIPEKSRKIQKNMAKKENRKFGD